MLCVDDPTIMIIVGLPKTDCFVRQYLAGRTTIFPGRSSVFKTNHKPVNVLIARALVLLSEMHGMAPLCPILLKRRKAGSSSENGPENQQVILIIEAK